MVCIMEVQSRKPEVLEPQGGQKGHSRVRDELESWKLPQKRG